jgi:hypothetical protein
MSRILKIVGLFIFIAGCTGKPAPVIYENCVTVFWNDDSLVIRIKTKSDPRQYPLEIGQVYFNSQNEARSLSIACCVAKVDCDFVVIEIDMIVINKLIQDKDFQVSVLLYNQDRGKEEFYWD